jgi:hypothetical protein
LFHKSFGGTIMADYTNYNQGSGNKGAIAAIAVLALFIIGIFVLAANAPPAQDGAVSSDPATAIESQTTIADPTTAPAIAD